MKATPLFVALWWFLVSWIPVLSPCLRVFAAHFSVSNVDPCISASIVVIDVIDQKIKTDHLAPMALSYYCYASCLNCPPPSTHDGGGGWRRGGGVRRYWIQFVLLDVVDQLIPVCNFDEVIYN